MSYDPNPNAPYAPPATTPGIPVQQPSAPFATGAPDEGRKKGLMILGIAVLVAGVGGGVAAFLASGSAADEGVENLARAPVGCTTRLDFDDAGTFTIYVETKGSTGDLGGDCPNDEEEYDRDDEDLPDVELRLVDSNDEEIDLEDDDGKSYDAGGAVGQSIKTVEIEDAGRFELTVTSDDDDFAIAIGKNPEQSADTLKLISYALLGAGIVLGALLILLGRRRKPSSGGGVGAPVTYYPEQQPPAQYQPTGTHTPPASPPYGGPPSYTPPPAAPQPQPQYPPTQQMPAPQWPAPPTQ